MSAGDLDDIRALRQHVEDLFAAHYRVHDMEAIARVLAKKNADESLLVALSAMDKRMEAANELRGALSDLSKEAISRTEYSAAYKSLDDKYDSKYNSLSKLVWMGLGAVGIAGGLVNLILYFVTKRG